MKYMRVLLVISLVLLPALCRGADDGYGYPIPGSYEATIMGTPAELKPELPKEVPVKQFALEIFPDRQKPEVFFYNEGLRCTLAYQKEKAPLVFLVAGTGSDHASAKLVSMMKQLYQAGFHVVTLPSPTHPNFIISASGSSVPGDLTEDAADLYRVMEKVWDRVKEDIEVSDFYLGGYSLGGTQAAFVAKLDRAGNFLWNTFFGSEGALDSSTAHGIALDASGNKVPGTQLKLIKDEFASAFEKRSSSAFGVPVGANSSTDVSTTASEMPASCMIGTSGRSDQRSAPLCTRPLSTPDWM